MYWQVGRAKYSTCLVFGEEFLEIFGLSSPRAHLFPAVLFRVGRVFFEADSTCPDFALGN